MTETLFKVSLVIGTCISFLNLILLNSDLEAIRAGVLTFIGIYILVNWEKI